MHRSGSASPVVKPSAGWGSATDDVLLVAAAQWAEAFSTFYRRYERAVLAYFVWRVQDPGLSADLTAEVFTQALMSVGRFRPGGAPASAWLFSIAQHTLAKSRRRGRVEARARRRLGVAPIVLEDEALERIAELASLPDVMRLLEALPQEQRDAVRSRIVEERGYGEIATDLQCSEAVVRQRVSRGLERLRDQLKEDT
jgi:RNA polymerase sigma factor (sigma-70 family)